MTLDSSHPYLYFLWDDPTIVNYTWHSTNFVQNSAKNTIVLTPRLLGWHCREQLGRLRRRPVADPEPRHRGVEEDKAEPALHR